MGIFGSDAAAHGDVLALQARVEHLEHQVAALQAAVAQLRDQPGTVLSAESDPYADLRELKRQGRVIQAIKLARERTGLGLKEAKDLVEGL